MDKQARFFLVIAGIAVIGFVWCWFVRCRPCPPPPPAFASNLSLQGRGVGAWVAVTNKFSDEVDPDPTDSWEPDNPRWHGVMVQLGYFGGPVPYYQRMEFRRGGLAVPGGTYSNTQRLWVNIVSDRAGVAAPMEIEESLLLYPQTEDADDVFERALHRGQVSISSIITYWTGNDGYDTRTGREGDALFEFRFNDDWAAHVYEITNNPDGTFSVGDAPIAKYTSNETASDAEHVDELFVIQAGSGPGDWQKQEPPWPDDGP